MASVSSKKSAKRRSCKETTNSLENEADNTSFVQNITYDVLRMIFEYCSAKDLSRAAMVCRSWNEAASKEMKTRIKPEAFQCELSSRDAYHLPQNVADNLYVKPAIGLLFKSTQRGNTAFHSGAMCCIQGHSCNHFQRDGDYLTICNDGLIFNDNEIEDESNTIAGLFLPEIPDVKIKCFMVNDDDITRFRRTAKQKNRDKLARQLCKISPNEEDVKCIMLFSNDAANDHCENAKQLLRTFTSHRSKKREDVIALWGGISYHVAVCSRFYNINTCNTSLPLAGISVCGTGVSSWSVVLSRGVKSKAQAERELTAFRDGVKLQKYTIGFMFACCGRGTRWYSEDNVESSLFRKLFPNVPLVGSFGNGEFGLTTIPRSTKESDFSTRKRIKHEYCTVFLIITYGSMKKSR